MLVVVVAAAARRFEVIRRPEGRAERVPYSPLLAPPPPPWPIIAPAGKQTAGSNEKTLKLYAINK